MNVNFKGYGENVATFLADSTVSEGTLVKMSSSCTVTACALGDTIVGMCTGVRNGYAAVQLSGYVEFPCPTPIDVGFTGISAVNGTTVKSDAEAKKYLVVSSMGTMVGFIL